MGKAHKAPRPTRGIRHNISRIAGARLRDLVGLDFLSRSDGDLCRLLDERLRDANEPLWVTDVERPECSQAVYELTFEGVANNTRVERTVHAVCRQGTCVTVLAQDMVSHNLRTGRWIRATSNDAEAEVEDMQAAPLPPLAVVPPLPPSEPVAIPEPPEPGRSCARETRSGCYEVDQDHRGCSCPCHRRKVRADRPTVEMDAAPPPAPAAGRPELLVNCDLEQAALGVELVEAKLALATIKIAHDDAVERVRRAEAAIEAMVAAFGRV